MNELGGNLLAQFRPLVSRYETMSYLWKSGSFQANFPIAHQREKDEEDLTSSIPDLLGSDEQNGILDSGSSSHLARYETG